MLNPQICEYDRFYSCDFIMLHGVIYFKRGYLGGPDLITGGPIKPERFFFCCTKKKKKSEIQSTLKNWMCHCWLEVGGDSMVRNVSSL